MSYRIEFTDDGGINWHGTYLTPHPTLKGRLAIYMTPKAGMLERLSDLEDALDAIQEHTSKPGRMWRINSITWAIVSREALTGEPLLRFQSGADALATLRYLQSLTRKETQDAQLRSSHS
jgi:hypothetical protein